MHSLNLRISLQSSLPQLPSNSTLLHAPKRNPRITILARINPNHPRLDLSRDPMRLLQISRENRSPQPILARIRPRDSFSLIFESTYHGERAEDFFLPDRHGVGDVCENCGLDEEAFAVDGTGFAAHSQRRAFFLSGLDVREDAVELGAGDLWALESGLIPLRADFGDAGDCLFVGGDEVGVDGALDEDPRSRGADLALVRHDPRVGPFDRLLEVGVCEDEEGGFAACFEGDVFEGLGREAHYAAGGGGRACEGYFVDERMLDEGGACFGPEAVEDVYYAWGEAGLGD